MDKKNPIDLVAMILVIIGALNWGLVGVASMDLVKMIADAVGVSLIGTIVYVLVALSGLYMIYATWIKK